MTKQTQRMIKGTLILSIAGIIAKIISVLYKIPLNYLTGDIGLGYYGLVYPLYSLLTAAALIGIPNSISKLVAEEIALKEYKKAHMTFRYALIITAIFGVLVSAFLFGFGEQIVKLAGWDKNAIYVLWGLSISPVFISISGAIRGYLQGMQIMVPTAISQIIENAFKVLIGIGLVWVLLNQGNSIPVAVGGAAIGTSVGFIIATVYLIFVYIKKRGDIRKRIDGDNKSYLFSTISKRIIGIAIPVTIASAALSVMNLIDSLTITRLLDGIGYTSTMSTEIVGLIEKARTIINVPLVISVSLIINIVPSVSAANIVDNKSEVTQKIYEAIQIAIKLALPATFGLIVLAQPILTLVYGQNNDGALYLQLFSISIVFIVLGQSLTGVLHGLSKYYISLYILLISAITKLGLNILLVNETFKGCGALISSNVYYLLISVLSFLAIKKYFKNKFNIIHAFGKPLIASIVMGIIAWGSYRVVYSIISSNSISVIASIGLGALVYLVMMILLKGFTRDELMILPKHQRLIQWLEKRKLLD